MAVGSLPAHLLPAIPPPKAASVCAADQPMTAHWGLHLGALISNINFRQWGLVSTTILWGGQSKSVRTPTTPGGTQNICITTGAGGIKIWFFAYMIYGWPLMHQHWSFYSQVRKESKPSNRSVCQTTSFDISYQARPDQPQPQPNSGF